MDPHHRVQSYYGYAFESWCTSSPPVEPTNLQPDADGWGGDVDTNVQWCSVVKTKLGGTRMVIGGEVDCVRGAFFFHNLVSSRMTQY
jgi:RAT1-interacting protein